MIHATAVDDQLSRLERMGRRVPYQPGCVALITATRLVIAVGVIVVWCWVTWTRRRALDRYRCMRSALRAQHERVFRLHRPAGPPACR